MGETYFQEFGPNFLWVKNIFRNLVPFFMGEKYFQGSGQKYNDFLKTKKMRNVRTINLAVVSRRDLYYVSENNSFCF